MATPYKALQNKAFHKGAYIGYVVARDQQFTTNGHFMINCIVDSEEVKVISDQIDRRTDGQPMIDLTKILTELHDPHTGTYKAGKLSHYTDTHGNVVLPLKALHGMVLVQKVYVDYVEARLKVDHWYIAPSMSLAFAVDDYNKILAVIAAVKE